MQRDFHYYCIFVLANLAGYTRDEAKIIAYCSQFVDDSLDSEQIEVKTKDGKDKYLYDTVRTAHAGIRSFDWNVHKKIYFPFHFIPAQAVNGQPFSYVTQANSEFAQQLLDDAISDPDDLKLYRMGVAIHTYADTWAHEHFSGRKHKENDIQKIEKEEKGKWRNCQKFWDPIVDQFRAYVGHIQAYKYPDYAYVNWRYKDYKGTSMPARMNAAWFLQAASEIFKKLALARGTDNTKAIWGQNEDKIKKILQSRPTDESSFLKKAVNKVKEAIKHLRPGITDYIDPHLKARCDLWVEQYGDFFNTASGTNTYQYSYKEWRKKAIDYARAGNLTEFLGTDWAKFQRAALKQRHFVLERLM